MQQQQQQPYIARRRVILPNNTNKTRADEFYTKLERIRLSAAAASSSKRTAAELLNESKGFFVKSEQVLRDRPTRSNDRRIAPAFRSAQPRRFPYRPDLSEEDHYRFDDSFRASTPPPTNTSDSAFESISVLSLSDQTTLDNKTRIRYYNNNYTKHIAQTMFTTKNVIKTQSRSSTIDPPSMTVTTKLKQRSSSLSHTLHQVVDFVQRKLSRTDDDDDIEKQQLAESRDLLLILLNANTIRAERASIKVPVAEHQSNDIVANDSSKIPNERTLIRVPRLIVFREKALVNDRSRRDLIDGDEIWGMAKKVAITVFVLVPVCIICCIVTTIYICMKCCCGRNNDRKRNQGFMAVPQPVVIHTGSANYQPQYHQQQAPVQTWNSPESRPVVPQPSAPPLPNEDFHMDLPPPYEKVCTSR